MEHKTSLGRSSLQVPRMGVGAMVWGQPKGLGSTQGSGPLDSGTAGLRALTWNG